jgi:hypothetical protein
MIEVGKNFQTWPTFLDYLQKLRTSRKDPSKSGIRIFRILPVCDFTFPYSLSLKLNYREKRESKGSSLWRQKKPICRILPDCTKERVRQTAGKISAVHNTVHSLIRLISNRHTVNKVVPVLLQKTWSFISLTMHIQTYSPAFGFVCRLSDNNYLSLFHRWKHCRNLRASKTKCSRSANRFKLKLLFGGITKSWGPLFRTLQKVASEFLGCCRIAILHFFILFLKAKL